MAKFHRNIFSLSKNIAKSLGGLLLLTHIVRAYRVVTIGTSGYLPNGTGLVPSVI